MYQLDSLDARILQVLQTDGRIPMTKLSEQLNIPHGTLRDRIRKMEQAGVIERYTAVINPARMGYLIECFVELVLDHQVETSRAIEALRNIDEVTEIDILTGETDALVRIWARDVEHLRQILYDKFTAIPGLVRTNTLVVLSAWEKPVPLSAQLAKP
jgi:Lrp/AsnC family transcriptional regulator for asnA, asnC and gidA